MARYQKERPDPSWPPRPAGGTWGDPRSKLRPFGVQQDAHWRKQLEKEYKLHYDQQKATAARLAARNPNEHTEAVVSETTKRIFGDPAVAVKMAQREDPDHRSMAINPAALEKALTLQLKEWSESVQSIARKLVEEQRRRIEAELAAAVAAAERAAAARELADLKRTVGDFKKLQATPQHVLRDAHAMIKKSKSAARVGSSRSHRQRAGGLPTSPVAMSSRSSRGGPGTGGKGSARESARGAWGKGGKAGSDKAGLESKTNGGQVDVPRLRQSVRSSRRNGGAGGSVSETASVVTASTRFSSGSGWKTPKSWRGKSLDQLLAEKRAQRTRRSAARE